MMFDRRSKVLITLGLIFGVLGVLSLAQLSNFGKLRIIFCDVGQGDGILIISPQGHEAVVDAGQGTKMAGCLSRYMPFWDRQVELISPTHAHEEHMEGFLEILSRYEVKNVLTTNIANNTRFYSVWQKTVAQERANVAEAGSGETVLLDPSSVNSPKLEVLWPTPAYEAKWKSDPPADLNEASIVMRLSYGPPAGGFCMYLTGDLPKEILERLIDRPCQVLKVVHHGSKTGTNDEVLNRAKPELAVIQVGKDNQFGHPHKEVLDLLSAHNVKVLRNDLAGTIEIDSDGSGYQIR